MKFTLLGTGTSTGVPSIGCDCETCTSDDPRDQRLRVSVLVEHAGQTVLVDTSSDFRQQALRHRIRRLNFRHGPLGVYANERAWVDLRRIFKYVFEPTHFGGGLPQVVAHTVTDGAPFCLGRGLEVTPVEVIHGRLPVVAYRFNDFAYATDLSEIPPPALERLRGLDVLVLDCLRVRPPHPTHLTLERALQYVEELRPRRAFFTHITHDVKHARDSALLPPGVEFAYDGLEIEEG